MQFLPLLFITSLINFSFGQQRIINGHTAAEGEFPYQALIYDYHTYCGGSIIHKRWILSVAHCEYKDYTTLGVFVGTNKNFGLGGTRYTVKTIIKNKNFINRPNVVLNDIALLRVGKDIEFNNKVKPINLPLNNFENYENAFATVSGWGKLRPTSNSKVYLPRNLQFVTVQVINEQRCRRSWSNLAQHQLCTSIPDGKATCEGDSGDPLVMNNTQIGIACYADAQCGLHRPVVYTKVSSFLPWIRKQLNLFDTSLQFI